MDLIPPSQGLEMVPFHGLARLRGVCESVAVRSVCESAVVFLGVRHPLQSRDSMLTPFLVQAQEVSGELEVRGGGEGGDWLCRWPGWPRRWTEQLASLLFQPFKAASDSQKKYLL